jgi:hypothetical protein
MKKILIALAVWGSGLAFAQTGALVSTINIATASTIPNGTLGGPCTNYTVQYQTIDTAHIIKCTNTNTRVTNVGVWTDITAAGGGGGLASSGAGTIPKVLSGNTTAPATGSDIAATFGTLSTGCVLFGAGNCAVPNLSGSGVSGTWPNLTISGGSATLPTTTLVYKGNGSGGAVAATPGTDYLAPASSLDATKLTGSVPTGSLPVASTTIGAVKSAACAGGTHASGAFAVDGTPSCTADTGGAATIPSGTTANAGSGAANSAGALYAATDAATGMPFYFRPSTGASPVQLLTLGASGALSLTGGINGPVLDINTSVVPQVGNSQTWAGTQTFANAACSGTCTGFGTTGIYDDHAGHILLGSGITSAGAGTVRAVVNLPGCCGGGADFAIGGNDGSAQVNLYTHTDGGIGLYNNTANFPVFAVDSTNKTMNIDSSLRLTNTGTKPTCATGIRGTFWYTNNGGARDNLQVCVFDGSSFLWTNLY